VAPGYGAGWTELDPDAEPPNDETQRTGPPRAQFVFSFSDSLAFANQMFYGSLGDCYAKEPRAPFACLPGCAPVFANGPETPWLNSGRRGAWLTQNPFCVNASSYDPTAR
jgi:hypothetical protein